jgi:hypothetical protein
MDENLSVGLSESPDGAAGIEVEELEQESFEPITPDGNQRWQGQLRRVGSAGELPGPQRFRDFPTWLTEPHKHPAREQALAETLEDALA